MHPAVFLPLVLLPFSLAKTTTVKVGDDKDGIAFSPNNVTAVKGDTIEFIFYQRHSVAQSTFDKPCQPSDKGVYSGIISSSSGPANQTFTVTVNDTNPIWFYCSVPGHCQGGMAMVVNEPKDKTLQTYKDNSKTAQTSSPSVVEGGVLADQSSGGSSSVSSKATASSATAAATGSSTSAKSASSTSASASASAKPNAVGKVGAGAGLGALGLLGVLVGGMV